MKLLYLLVCLIAALSSRASSENASAFVRSSTSRSSLRQLRQHVPQRPPSSPLTVLMQSKPELSSLPPQEQGLEIVERQVGRVAMMGFVGVAIVELLLGQAFFKLFIPTLGE
ncbi:unnamed protein product [Vitrella brassicaformis CCMP3155]|uniref:Uncharacterized protein n=2 Tax=Vitrella brassicaformis TaxID=1169539 RepID=A0A0G4EHJ6_VITBC|nr:unnamed protein product [Vitrella brassicaformis CCMP3155]|eukprot:CEL95655.1 unnamed protein product [Vitrella brassicaformis CCMP3155]